MDSPENFCIKHDDEPIKSPKSLPFRTKREILHMLYYTNIIKISPNGRNDILLISDLLLNHQAGSTHFPFSLMSSINRSTACSAGTLRSLHVFP